MEGKMSYPDLLVTLFRKQTELMKMIGIDTTNVPDLELVEKHTYAIMKEAMEMKDEFPWEWWQWKKQKKLEKGIDIDRIREELIDIQFFVLGAAILLDMTPVEFSQLYLDKSKKNMERLKQTTNAATRRNRN